MSVLREKRNCLLIVFNTEKQTIKLTLTVLVELECVKHHFCED